MLWAIFEVALDLLLQPITRLNPMSNSYKITFSIVKADFLPPNLILNRILFKEILFKCVVGEGMNNAM